MATETISAAVAAAAEKVPERHYTHNESRGNTPHRTNPTFVRRDLSFLDVGVGMSVAEVGTGSGLTGGFLAELVGPTGKITSLDIDPFLTAWTNRIHHERGVTNVRCFTVDGTSGYPERAPYDRLGAWCTPPRLPRAWVEQMTEGGLIVATLPIASLPKMVIGATIRINGGEPVVESLFPGGYIETAASPRSNFDVPARWVDWEARVPSTSWISVAWREQDDWLHTGARTALDRLREPGHTEQYQGGELDWSSWRTWASTTGTRLTMTELTLDNLALGHSTRETAAVIHKDGTILADSPDSGSLTVLRGWLAAWEDAGRPAPDTYIPTLVPDMDSNIPGWDLRLTR
ncbi:protein-L-isoaspartate(D-aspartate) O-methyltransferase [Streptomyces olivoreticuli]